MGCDIHTMVEVNSDSGEYWFAVDNEIFDYPYFRADEPLGRLNHPLSKEPYSGRNYPLFAFLADVRNGVGFAGIDTGDAIKPIDGLRGVPENASDEWKQYVEEWGCDLHSMSYFTLAELEAADWNQQVTQRGFVPEAVYLELRGTNKSPETWCGYAWGGDILTLLEEEYNDLAGSEDLEGKDVRVQYQWSRPIREICYDFYIKCIDNLRLVAPPVGSRPEKGQEDYRPKDHTKVRLVFGFDN